MRKNRSFSGVIILIIVSLVLGFLIGKYYKSINNPQYKLFRTSQNMIDRTLEIITQAYVDTVNVGRLTEGAVAKIVSELDPHSAYIPVADVTASNEELEVSFGGIGVMFNMQFDTILVVNIISGGPAEKAGLIPFDRIITINDSVVAGKGINSQNIMKMLRGPKNTKVRVGIQRGDETELVDFELTRGDIPNNSIDVAYKVTDNIGYVRVSKFARNTYNEFITSLAKLQQQGATGFIIDLRDNGGGLLDAAVHMANEFLQKNSLIVYMEGHAYPRMNFNANGKGSWQENPVIVLINEPSASASEIFSGAIQDNDRGLIIGRRSFGKGLVQQKFELPDKSEIALTIARYYTPSGRCIQKEYELGKSDEYYLDFYNRIVHGERENADSIKIHEDLACTTLNGRTVYGGGGIMPDIFVPYDTTQITSYYQKVINTGTFHQFVLKYSDANRSKLKSFNTYEELYAYLKQQPLINEFTDYAASKGIPKRSTLINISRNLMETQLCASIVKNFFDNEGFYPIIRKYDEALNKAISIMEEGKWKPEI
ncbi:MAG: S41 family peptidase [Tannerella sp.]|jgi:carboxyl-terminal processing protease|nr:S41 family peptidase [Tannerella sp.]